MLYLYTLRKSPWAFSSHMKDVSVPYSSLWSFTGLSLGCSCLSCTGKPYLDPAVQLWSHRDWAEVVVESMWKKSLTKWLQKYCISDITKRKPNSRVLKKKKKSQRHQIWVVLIGYQPNTIGTRRLVKEHGVTTKSTFSYLKPCKTCQWAILLG